MLSSSTPPTSDFCWHSETCKSLQQARELLKEKHVAQEFWFPAYFIYNLQKAEFEANIYNTQH